MILKHFGNYAHSDDTQSKVNLHPSSKTKHLILCRRKTKYPPQCTHNTGKYLSSMYKDVTGIIADKFSPNCTMQDIIKFYTQ